MLWTSLQTGWANTSAIFALALLPIILIGGTAPNSAGRERAKIEHSYVVAVDQQALDLSLASN